MVQACALVLGADLPWFAGLWPEKKMAMLMGQNQAAGGVRPRLLWPNLFCHSVGVDGGYAAAVLRALLSGLDRQ